MKYDENILDFKYKRVHPNAVGPKKTKGNIGWDVCCVEDENFVIQYPNNQKCMELAPGERHVFDTGLQIELPENYHIEIWPRSGMAAKKGIDRLAGVCDNIYRGNYKICLINTSNKTVAICPGDKIAQLIIIKENIGSFREVDELSTTSRGDKGFGSSGT